MKFVVSLTILVVLLLLIPDGDAWGRRRRSSRRRRRWVKKVGKAVGRAARGAYKFYNKHSPFINTAATIGATVAMGGDAESHINEIATLKSEDHEAYNEYMQLLQDDLTMRFPEEDVNEMIASLDELADMQPDERADVLRRSQAEHSDNDHEHELIDDMSDEISE